MLKNKVRVVVIGGGMAGLSAAQHLVENDFKNVKVLEATDRLGGRIRTAEFGAEMDCIVELGANWIHGASLSNSIYVLASQFGLLKNAPLHERLEGFFYDTKGETIPKEVSSTIWKYFQQWDSEVVYGRFEKGMELTSVDKYLEKRFESLLRNNSELPFEYHGQARAVFNCLMNYFRFHVGGYLENMICGEGKIESHREIPGGNVKVIPGMTKLIQRLQNILPDNVVRLRREVTKIQWSENPALPILVTCKNGEEYIADHVIVTVSLSYLKNNHANTFKPLLPKWKTDSLQKMAMGNVNKIFLEYKKPFWTAGNGSIKLAWDNVDSQQTNLAHCWYKKIFSFDEVLNNPSVLVAWISGDEAKYMETLSDDNISTTCTAIIRQFTGNPSIPHPIRVLRSRWCSNPYTQGSYSYICKNSSPEDIRSLAKPITAGPTDALLFAGEATSVNDYSTMHGARDSGIREAQRLVNAYTSSASKL